MCSIKIGYRLLLFMSLSTGVIYADSNPAFDFGTSIGKSIGGLFSSKEGEKASSTTESNVSKSSGGISGFFGSLFKEPTLEETLQSTSDKEMTKSFYDLQKSNSKFHFSFSKNKISSESTIIPFDSAAMFHEARSLCAKIDSSNDEIAKIYKQTILNRGNYYDVYTGTINSSILATIQGKLPSVNSYNDEFYKYDFDNAIVEYSQDGTMLSSLVRFDKITLNSLIKSNDINYANIRISQVSTIFMREPVSLVSRTMAKRLLDDNLVMSTKKVNATPQNSISSTTVQQPTISKTVQIKELFELYKAGGLTKEEFEKEKTKLLEGEKNQSPMQSSQPSSQTTQKKALQNPFEAMMLQKINQQNGTNFTTMQEVQQYAAQQKNK